VIAERTTWLSEQLADSAANPRIARAARAVDDIVCGRAVDALGAARSAVKGP
jgi:hypothetical protein